MKKMKQRLKYTAFTVVTAAAGYLIISALDLAFADTWKPTLIPMQVSMFVVGAAWLVAFAVANGYFGGEECTTEE